MPESGFLSELPSLVKDFWSSSDKNKDGQLSRQEIDQAMLDPAITGKDAAALATCKSSFDWLSNLYPWDGSTKDAITRRDIDELAHYEGGANYLTAERIFSDQIANLNDYQNTTYSAHTSNKPDRDDPVQGPLGDCYLISTLSSFADKRPEQIQNLITENKSKNSYTVEFRIDDASWKTEVPKPTESKIAYYGSPVDWPLAVQSAYGRFITEGPLCSSRKYEKEMLTLHGLPKTFKAATLYEDNLTSGGYPMIPMMVVGGKSTLKQLFLTGDLSNPEKEKVEQLFKSGVLDSCPTVASTKDDVSVYKLGLVPSHSYSVRSYSPERHSVLIRNPYGSRTEVPSNSDIADIGGGEIEVPFETFLKAFHDIDMYYDHPRKTSDDAFAEITPIGKQNKSTNLYLMAFKTPKKK